MKIVVLMILCCVHRIYSQINHGKNFTLAFKWNTLDFKWTDEEQKSDYLNASKFIPSNCYIREFIIHKDFAFISIPRWKSGVPATLARISSIANVLPTAPDLEPYPSWSMQTIGDCSALQSVHSLNIDNHDRLWVLDNGLMLELESNQTYCSPKLVIFNLVNNTVNTLINIPEEMKNKRSFFTSMTLDKEKHLVYIADSNYYDSGFLIYDYATTSFRRFTCEQLSVEDEYANVLFIPSNLVPEFVSISLNTNKNKLYFSTFDTTDLLYVNASVFSQDSTDISSYIMNLGTNGRNAKLISDAKGYMYFDLTNQKSVAQWREGSWVFQYSPRVAIHSKLLYHWISSLFMDERTGYLWIVSSRFMDYVSDRVNIEKENVRVYRAVLPRKEKPKKPKSGGFSLEYIVLALFVVIIGLIIAKIVRFNYE